MLENIYTTKMSADKKSLQKRFTKIRSGQSRNSKLTALITSLAIIATMLCATIVMAAIDTKNNERYKIEVSNNSQKIEFENKPFFKEYILYLPFEELLQKIGALASGNAEIAYNGDIILINITEDVPSNYDNKTNRLNYCFQIQLGQTECILNPAYSLPADQQHLSIKKEMKDVPVIENGVVYLPFEYVRYMLNRFTQTYYISYKVWDIEYIYSTDREADFTNDNIHMDYFDNHKNLYVSSEHEIKQFVMWPCENGSISREFDPSNGHNGTDIAASAGAAVVSAISGTVTKAGYDTEKGNFVVITSKNTITDHVITTVYNHLATLDVTAGNTVMQGDIIGTVGNTGMSTGAHLHFEIKIDDTYYNPQIIY